MKFKLIFLLLSSVFLFSCGKGGKMTGIIKDSVKNSASIKTNPLNLENLTGKWVNAKDQMGFEIFFGGRAASINMPALDFVSWKIDLHNLTLHSISKGDSNPVKSEQVFIIRELSTSRLIVSPIENPGTWWTYEKIK